MVFGVGVEPTRQRLSTVDVYQIASPEDGGHPEIQTRTPRGEHAFTERRDQSYSPDAQTDLDVKELVAEGAGFEPAVVLPTAG